MSNKRRVAERDHTLMIPLADIGGQVAVSTNALFVGPGEPGPGDDWQMPPESVDGTSGETTATTEATRQTQDEPHRRGRGGQ